ncbi:MAG: quinolinate synthase NadA [Candidatus Methanomethylophilaceae archaeon]
METVREKIARLKKERNAIILAHNYAAADVQDIADYVGDSLGLSIEASKTDSDVIVFCGVTFMGESAKILSPGKTVLMPVPDALCDMASMCSSESLAQCKKEHPGHTVVGYVNTTGETKTQMDICCTSGNALKVVSSIDSDRILFVPDKNLGAFIAERIPNKEIVLWDGCCPIHDSITREQILELKRLHPGCMSMAHPECRKEVLDEVDFIGSTEAMLKECKTSDRDEFIIVTEVGMKHRLEKECPGKRFHFPGNAVCESMKRVTPELVASCLENMTGEIVLSDEVIRNAYLPVKRMTEIR